MSILPENRSFDTIGESAATRMTKAEREELRKVVRSRVKVARGDAEALIEQFRQIKAMGAIPPDMHRRLIQLCHPDKHGGSTAATEVTRWLLEVRP